MKLPFNYLPNALTHSQMIFEALMKDVPWERRADAPRYESWQLQPGAPLTPYTYGRGAGVRTYIPTHYGDLVRMISRAVKMITGCHFDGCFLNRYDGERDWLGWHSDDSPEMDDARPIPIVTFGAERVIQFRAKPVGLFPHQLPAWRAMNPQVLSQPLGSGSILIMPPGFQDTHEHRIPKSGSVVGPRVSLTFRGLV